MFTTNPGLGGVAPFRALPTAGKNEAPAQGAWKGRLLQAADAAPSGRGRPLGSLEGTGPEHEGCRPTAGRVGRLPECEGMRPCLSFLLLTRHSSFREVLWKSFYYSFCQFFFSRQHGASPLTLECAQVQP